MQRLFGTLEVAHLEVDVAEVGVDARSLRREAQRLLHGRECGRSVTALVAQHSKELPGVCTLRIVRDDLRVDLIGLLQAAGPV